MTEGGSIMKINNLNDPSSQMIQSYQRGDSLSQSVDKQAGPAPAAAEKVNISSVAKDIQKAKTVINNLPEVRDAKVQELKTQIEQGSYQVNSSKIAEKMIGENLIDLFA
jgi:negative regulator of flagellin synthesis FlgM